MATAVRRPFRAVNGSVDNGFGPRCIHRKLHPPAKNPTHVFGAIRPGWAIFGVACVPVRTKSNPNCQSKICSSKMSTGKAMSRPAQTVTSLLTKVDCRLESANPKQHIPAAKNKIPVLMATPPAPGTNTSIHSIAKNQRTTISSPKAPMTIPTDRGGVVAGSFIHCIIFPCRCRR